MKIDIIVTFLSIYISIYISINNYLSICLFYNHRILDSLSRQKFKVLKRISSEETATGAGIKATGIYLDFRLYIPISYTDSFSFNEQFISPMRKLRIPMASLEDSHNLKRVEEDRSIVIEAAIVRIMKVSYNIISLTYIDR